MFDAPQTQASRIAGVAALLSEIRRGRRDPIPGLPESLQPADAAEAEAMQLATYAAMGWSIAGWKLGRAGAHTFAVPLPDARFALTSPAPLHLPIGTGMELEAALRLTRALDAEALAALTPDSLTGIADLVLLYELVETRYAAGTALSDLEKIADCMANGSVVFGPATGAWCWADLETLAMRLAVDGIEVARHDGPHRAAPLSALVLAWRDRCLAIGHLPQAGEVLTFGSLTGLLPVPAAGGTLTGEMTGRGSLVCQVAPLGGP